ncbi:preprotein translocase subunit SecA [Caulifigura coniformis]|uniref:Protein translocase subunit SecA n=1 Tax=Caulifigura coniformis TaxID=2527983 RepID=A0A517SDH9_9PLAN|nr:translocase [Caulifigura coniformis]QDT54167.1 preprotein translocase subunit SecA [Caulifigura coniformis]
MLSPTLLRWRLRAARILRARKRLEKIGDVELKRRAQELGWRARGGESLKSILPQVFPLGIEACRRELGMTHFPVQIMGGLAIFHGHIAEMQTGEGKTLTAILPAALHAIVGKGCHVLTANDYLAQRDAELLTPVYKRLGLTAGCVVDQMEDDERRKNYACDITYGTATQVGFDFLRDRIKRGAQPDDEERNRYFVGSSSGEAPVQRGLHFALVDEADSILIDEARTPLIIGLQQVNRSAMLSMYRWATRIVPKLRPNEDFLFQARKRQAFLTDIGCRRLNLTAKPLLMDSIDTERIYQHVEKALTAQYAFAKDRDYVIVDDKVAIVDEGTGRVMDGRQWQEGLHQAIEAKEHLPISPITGSAARISIQTLFRQYHHLGGMTGTALSARTELKRIYKLPVVRIPTNRRSRRKGLLPRAFASQDAKREAIVESVREMVESGRSVLIGTPSVDASEALALKLSEHGINHRVLNARYHDEEAGIVKEAGRSGAVTIATNMAGRGTDIHLDDEVRKSGGLHVIATEMHSSLRIDRQLIGRAARQGDPGSYQFFLSLEDELLRVVEPKKLAAWRSSAGPDELGELSREWVERFQSTQQQLERLHVKQRKEMLKHEREQLKKSRKVGIDPFLELADA